MQANEPEEMKTAVFSMWKAKDMADRAKGNDERFRKCQVRPMTEETNNAADEPDT